MTAMTPILEQLPKTAILTADLPEPRLTRTLRDLGIHGAEVTMQPGVRVATAHVKLPSATRVREVRSLAEDLALRLELTSVRVRTGVEAGKVTLELADNTLSVTRVSLGDVLDAEVASTFALPWAVGLQADGTPMLVDLAEAPHVLIGGQTGSGKSSHLHALIASLALTKTPDDLELIFVDPKQVDLVAFAGLPHVSREAVTTPRGAQALVTDLLDEAEFRYTEFANAGVADLDAYNAWAEQTPEEESMPRIVVIVDELAALMSGKAGAQLAADFTQLAQISRAAGIHLVMATQRPSSVSMPTQLRSQLTTRVACRMSTATDSRMILDSAGAEKLLGLGDTLMRWGGADAVRVQGVFVSLKWREWLVAEIVAAFTLDEEESNEVEEAPTSVTPSGQDSPAPQHRSLWQRLTGR